MLVAPKVQPDAELRGIVQRAFAGCHVERCSELEGGVSARAVAVDLLLEGGAHKRVVVRRPRCSTPEATRRTVTHEHQLLTRCVELGIPAPMPCFLDLEVAAIVLEYLEGAPDLTLPCTRDKLQQTAIQLARIHALALDDKLDFLQRQSELAAQRIQQPPIILDESLDEGRVRSTVNGLWPWPQINADVLLHGDYWPGNLLWREHRLVAVLDWEEATRGDPLADLAVARLDIFWAFGEEAMHAFTGYYRGCTQIDWTHLPHWDLCIALRPMSQLARWAPAYAPSPLNRPDITERSMRAGHQRFVEQALGQLK